jgi:hypothetical protein
LWYLFAVHVPVWLTLGVAGLVIVFGLYRIWLATRKRDPEADQTKRSLLGGGIYRMSPRTHVLVGIVYLLLGGALIATSFGWNPFGNAFGPSTETPAKDKAPTKGAIPIDGLPTKK